MRGRHVALVVAFATLGIGAVQAGPFDLPDPAMFVRPEDQKRARLLRTPCREADVGHGCNRINGRVSRALPCEYQIDSSTFGSLPDDQCVKMGGPRRYRGVWVDEFEGQQFIPAGTTPPHWPHSDPRSPEWREQSELIRRASIWFDTERLNLNRKSHQFGKRWLIEFIGRKTKYAGSYGHMGMSGQEIVADRLILIGECPATGTCA
jgi:hypothetical protein